jgi:hypothetical protein
MIYATAYAVVQGRRYTLAVCRMHANQRMDHVLRALLVYNDRNTPRGVYA